MKMREWKIQKSSYLKYPEILEFIQRLNLSNKEKKQSI